MHPSRSYHIGTCIDTPIFKGRQFDFFWIRASGEGRPRPAANHLCRGKATRSFALIRFIHPFAFILLTVAVWPKSGAASKRIVCLGWLACDLPFEIGQRNGVTLSQ